MVVTIHFPKPNQVCLEPCGGRALESERITWTRPVWSGKIRTYPMPKSLIGVARMIVS